MYRHDIRRSGATRSPLSSGLKLLKEVQLTDWSTPSTHWASGKRDCLADDWGSSPSLGDPLTAPVIAKGLVLVALPENHQVVAMDQETLEIKWRYVTDGRINTPPTIYKGLCLFGSHDGWVYCLRAEDGELVWRFRAAPKEKRIMAFGQLESPWPVPGSVLVVDDLAYFASGRGIVLDGGVALYAIEPESGKVVWKTQVPSEPREFGLGYNLLVSDGRFAYLGARGSRGRFDLKGGKYARGETVLRLQCGGLGMFDGSWRRQPTSLGRGNMGMWSYGAASGREAGPLIVFDESRVFVMKPQFPGSGRYDVRILSCEIYGKRIDKDGKFIKDDPDWSLKLPPPLHIEAMTLAGETLFAAGPNDGVKPAEGKLLAVSAADGKKLNEWNLSAPPVLDGMAVAGGNLFVSTQDGNLLCFGREE